MKTILSIGLVLLGGGIFLWFTEPECMSAIVLIVVGLSPFTLWVSQNDKF